MKLKVLRILRYKTGPERWQHPDSTRDGADRGLQPEGFHRVRPQEHGGRERGPD